MAGAFNEDLTLWVGSLGPEAAKQLAALAHTTEREIVSNQQSRRGIAPGVREVVDGQEGKPFESVKPSGVIFLGFDYRLEIVKACFDQLKARSPVVSGDYIKGHFCILDGQGLGPLQLPTQAEVSKTEEIIITNPLPYSRKLEVGITESGAPFVKQVDPHIYESVMQAVRREFGSVAKFRFTFVDLENAYISKSAANARERVKRGARVAKSETAAMRYPAILIDRI